MAKQAELEKEYGRPRRRPRPAPQATEPAWPSSDPPAPTDPVRHRERATLEATLAMLAVAVLSAGLATLFIIELWLADRILPGVYVWDVDLGGLTREEAMAHLEAEFHYPADRHPSLQYGDQSWPVTPADLGLRLDVARTVDEAMGVGKRGELGARLKEQFDVLLDGNLIVPTFSFEAGTGSMYLNGIASQVNRPLRNATLSLGPELQVKIVPGQIGREVDEEATRQALVRRLQEMAGGQVPLVVRESQPLLADLSAAQAQVERILSGPLVLTAPGFEPWIIEPATLASWLILRPTAAEGQQASLSVSLDPGQVTNFAQELAGQVAREPIDAQFRFDESLWSLVPVVDSVPGQRLDVTTTVSLITAAAGGEERAFSLPLVPVPPALATSDADGLGIVDLIGEGVTNFGGSTASRVQNIVVGAAQFDGLLIAPGETFSFNHYLGEVTAEKGYEESIIIWGNTTRADVGGGLCQVSSTAFRAAFWAGVPIVERWPHAFRVSYYEPPKGLDATIYSPSVDLKWVNDTGHHILIQTYVDRANKTLTFRYYGTNPGRTVEIDGPHESNPVAHGPPVYRDDPTLAKGETRQIEWAKDGLDVTVYRILKEDDVEVQRDTFFSRYNPWQAVFLVGTKEEN